MAKQIIVTQNNYGILLETQFIDDAKNPIDLTGYSVTVEFEYLEKCFDVLDATILNAEEGRVGIILEQEHTAEIGLYKTQWSVVDDDENVTAQEDIYYFVKAEVAMEDEEKEEIGVNTESIIDKFKDLDETLLEYAKKLIEIEDINAILNGRTIRTPEDYGATGNSITDDSEPILNAFKDCATNGYVLLLTKKYRIAKDIIFTPYFSLNVIGSKGNYNSVTNTSIESFGNENCNLFFDGGSLEINKMGSVNFYGVGFSGKNRNIDNGIIIKSFHNRFTNCSFSQFNKAIVLEQGTNWTGENQLDHCIFMKNNICYEANYGSDCAIRHCIFHGSNEIGLTGTAFSGYNIMDNHLYTRQGSNIKGLNMMISNNYIQELSLYYKPSLIVEPMFGVAITNNKFELLPVTAVRTEKKALLGIKTFSGADGVLISNNTVTGKNNTVQDNLAFIEMLPDDSGTLANFPIMYGLNNIRACTAILKEAYPIYNMNGTLSLSSMNINVLGGTIESQKVEVINGICYFHVKVKDIPNYANLLKVVNFHGIPFSYTLLQTLKTGGSSVKNLVSTNGTITQSNYSEVSSVEVIGSYVVSHAGHRQYYLS